MPELYLIAADAALRTAIAEQLKLASLGGFDLHENINLPAEPGEGAFILCDAALIGRNTGKIFGAWATAEKKLKIFILGESGEESDLIAESFPKPLRLGHLMARLQFHAQASRAKGAPLAFGHFRLEPALRQITNTESGLVVRLTEKEAGLLEYLARSDTPIAREELLAMIWGYDGRIDTHTLETHIYRLRRKLDPVGETGALIVAEGGAYRLARESAGAAS